MISLIIGQGQIGSAVKGFISQYESVYTYDIKDEHKRSIPSILDVMHVCIPYSESFVEDVKEYIKKYEPKYSIIWSTVPIGTCRAIGGVVHSPVEGVHPKLEQSIAIMTRWISANEPELAVFFTDYFSAMDLEVNVLHNTDFTEALKLLSTAEYGANLVFADYKAYVAEKIGMSYQFMKDWNEDYNKLYHQLGLSKKFQKFVLDSPAGKIGGHCIIPNAKLLNKEYHSDILDMIEGME